MLVLFLGQIGKTLRRRINVGIVFRSNWEDPSETHPDQCWYCF